MGGYSTHISRFYCLRKPNKYFLNTHSWTTWMTQILAKKDYFVSRKRYLSLSCCPVPPPSSRVNFFGSKNTIELFTGSELKPTEQHFWHSVYGNLGSTVPGELMSKAITSDYIRTNGMPQSDKENNAANRLRETNRRRRKRFEKWSFFQFLWSIAKMPKSYHFTHELLKPLAKIFKRVASGLFFPSWWQIDVSWNQ